jgi:threonine dehydrogenase-like Zn-dependent dehydrogenase
MVMGHENTGEVIEVGRDVELIKRGDLSIGSFQRFLRPLPQLQGTAYRCV